MENSPDPNAIILPKKILILIGCVLVLVGAGASTYAQSWYSFIAEGLGGNISNAKADSYNPYGISLFVGAVTLWAFGALSDKYQKRHAFIVLSMIISSVGFGIVVFAKNVFVLRFGFVVIAFGEAIAAPSLWSLIHDSIPYRFATCTTVSLIVLFSSVAQGDYFLGIVAGIANSFHSASVIPVIIIFTFHFLAMLSGIVLVLIAEKAFGKTPKDDIPDGRHPSLALLLLLMTIVSCVSMVSANLFFVKSLDNYTNILKAFSDQRFFQSLAFPFMVLGGILADYVFRSVEKRRGNNGGYILMYAPVLLLTTLGIILSYYATSMESFILTAPLWRLSLALITATAPIALIFTYFPKKNLATWLGVLFALQSLASLTFLQYSQNPYPILFGLLTIAILVFIAIIPYFKTRTEEIPQTGES